MMLQGPLFMPNRPRNPRPLLRLALAVSAWSLLAMAGCVAQATRTAAAPTSTTIEDQAARFRRALVRREGSRLGSRGENAMATFDRALRAIVQQSVDPVSPVLLVDAAVGALADHAAAEATTGQLVDLAIGAMMAAGDPDGSYVPSVAGPAPAADPSERFGGVGLELKVRDGVPLVVATVPQAPADRAGIATGDRVLAVDGVPTDGLAIRAAVERLRGPVGTPVEVTVQSDGREARTHRLERVMLQLQTAMVVRREGSCVDIRVSQFHDRTAPELAAALAGEGAGAKGLVLDLRGNGGGLLSSVVASADLFLDSGLIASVAGRVASARTASSATPGGPATRVPLLLLVDGETAAGAEIFAAALRDNGRARILGSRTAGRGTIQTTGPLGTAGSLKLTTLRVWTAAGTPGAAGVAPDLADDSGSTATAAGSMDALVQRAFAELDCSEDAMPAPVRRPKEEPLEEDPVEKELDEKELDNGPTEA
jgi:carboxyl-terminal processing protease